MKRREAMAQARSILSQNDVADAPLEAEVLLRHVLTIDRVRLYTEPDEDLNPTDEAAYFKLIDRRKQGEPTAYLTGHREFYGLDFIVNRNVLIPRPESELLVEKAIELAGKKRITTMADIGTGCGAIAISLAKNLPDIRIYATDISAPALVVAAENCRRHNLGDRVELLQGHLLEPLPNSVDLVIANMPYVNRDEVKNNSALKYEPSLALDGGADGLEIIKELCYQAARKLNTGGNLLLEMGAGQEKAVADIVRKIFPKAEMDIYQDYAGLARVVGVHLTSS